MKRQKLFSTHNKAEYDMSMYTYDIEMDDAGFFRMEPDWILLLVPAGCDRLSEREYNQASSRLSDLGYEFLYLPKLANKVPDDLLSYYIPECKYRNLPGAEVLQNRIIGELGIIVHSPLAILFKDGKFRCIESWEGDETTTEFLDFLFDYLESEGDEQLDFCVEPTCKEYYDACEDFIPSPDFSISRAFIHPCGVVAKSRLSVDHDEDYTLESLVRELQKMNEAKLRALGLSEDALRFLMGKVVPKLSRLRITKHSRIILDDYDGLEIKLDDKTKAMYFLFLRHPEGIAIKDLPDYINELMDLYQSISGRDDPDAMRRTIVNLADPFQNNANISLSRIKKAFCDAFTSTLASKYYVEGGRGEVRKIAIDRSLVTWETIR